MPKPAIEVFLILGADLVLSGTVETEGIACTEDFISLFSGTLLDSAGF